VLDLHASQQHPGHILVTLVADQWSADPAEPVLGGPMMAEIDELSCADDGYHHRRVQASAIDLTNR
jgi:hypothetical protein